MMLPAEADLRTEPGSRPDVSLALRLPWYRSLPLSCVDGIQIAVDGAPVPERDVTISVGDVEHSIADSGDLAEVEWFVLDRATATFPAPDGVAAGPHEVAVTLTLRIPYAEPEYWPIEFTQTAKHSRSIEFLGADR